MARRVSQVGQLGALGGLGVELGRQQSRLRQSRIQRARQGSPSHFLASLLISRQTAEPAAQRCDDGFGQEAVSIQTDLGDGEDRRVCKARVRQATAQVGLDIGSRAVGHAVQDDCGHHIARGGGAQVLPGDGVGVARRGGHEDP